MQPNRRRDKMSKLTLKELLTSGGKTETNDPVLVIEMPDEKLPVGGHTFALQVKDDSGNLSDTAQVMVIVYDDQKPTAVVRLLDERGIPVPGNRVPYSRSFILDGSRSSDIGGGKIVSYLWQLLD